MSLDRLALIFVLVPVVLWLTIMVTTAIALFPFGLVVLVVLGAVGYLFWRVISERLSNKEDDYYEKNVKR